MLLLRDAEPAKAKPLLLELARKWDGKDRFYLEALRHRGRRQQPRSAREVLLNDFDEHFPQWNASMAGLLWELRPPQAQQMIAKHLGDPLPLPQRLQMVDVLTGIADPAAGEVVLKALLTEKSPEVRDRLAMSIKQNLRGAWKKLDHAPLLAKAIELYSATSETLPMAFELMAAPAHDGFVDGAVIAMAEDAQASSSRCSVAALRVYAALFHETKRGRACTRFSTTTLRKSWRSRLCWPWDASVRSNACRLWWPAMRPMEPLPLRQAAVTRDYPATRAGSTWLLEAHRNR